MSWRGEERDECGDGGDGELVGDVLLSVLCYGVSDAAWAARGWGEGELDAEYWAGAQPGDKV